MLDALLVDPAFTDHIDNSRIMAAGFFYGEWTALLMGGMTGNHAGINEACTTNIDEMEAYDQLLSEGVNMQGTDPDVWNASYADVRITHVMAIDPSFHFTAIPLCTPAVEAIVIANKDDSVFTDPAGTDRAAVHCEIINIIANELGL